MRPGGGGGPGGGGWGCIGAGFLVLEGAGRGAAGGATEAEIELVRIEGGGPVGAVAIEVHSGAGRTDYRRHKTSDRRGQSDG